MVADPPESWLWRRTRGSTTPNRTIPSGIPQNLTVRLHLDFGIILIWSRLMSRLCIGARSGQIAVPITGRNSFSSCLLSRRRATECNYLDGMHHLHHGLMYLLPGAARIFARRKRQINGQIQQITAGCVLAHSTPARPFHETAIYLYNHYRYL